MDIFTAPISADPIPPTIGTRPDHPVPRLGIIKSGPIQTNKFFSNFVLGDQTAPVYTYPYSVSWSKGKGPVASWGLAISHIEAKQRTFGPIRYNNAASYYINPIGIQSMILSAKELGGTTVLTTDSITPFSARISLKTNSTSSPTIQFPLVQGMPYITGQFNGGTPLIQSGVHFSTMTRVAQNPKSNVVKYNFHLQDGTTWHVYAYTTRGAQLDLRIVNNSLAQATSPFYGIVQITKDPKTAGSERVLDDGAGVYPTGMQFTGSVSGSTGTYSFIFTRAGHPQGSIYMYALPHHISSFNADTRRHIQTLKLQTTTKGVATLVSQAVWTMTETGLPTNMDFAPWDPSRGSRTALSAAAKAAISPIASSEVSQDMNAQTDLNSMYFSGKVCLSRLIFLILQVRNVFSH